MNPNEQDGHALPKEPAAGAAESPTAEDEAMLPSANDIVAWELQGVITLLAKEYKVLRELSFTVKGSSSWVLGEMFNVLLARCTESLSDRNWVNESFFHLDAPLEARLAEVLNRLLPGRELPSCASVSTILHSTWSRDIPLERLAQALMEVCGLLLDERDASADLGRRDPNERPNERTLAALGALADRLLGPPDVTALRGDDEARFEECVSASLLIQAARRRLRYGKNMLVDERAFEDALGFARDADLGDR